MAGRKKFRSEYERVDRTNIKHVQLTEPLLGSAAWNALSFVARSLLIEFLRLHNGKNNGEIVLGVRGAADRLGCAKNTAQKAMVELQEKGFIHRVVRGHFGLGDREASVWRLTMYGTAARRSPTAEYLKWLPAAPARHETKHQSQFLGLSVSDVGTGKKVSVSELETAGLENCDRRAPSEHLAGPSENDTINLPSDDDNFGVKHDLTRLRKETREWLDRKPRGAQSVLARKINITPGHLSNFIGGRNQLSERTASRLQAYLRKQVG